ncbi:MAG: PKD domain-containing protein, partial [Hymenobacteraceae bacterium]|nr:PKD domain-containing protein [Hymenobacteraceae bacterium]MDX5395795.1 PKD domain-containing protein [Hymenobacteraceae bacterium]MDX5511850.1 PKD domain-containing protein [Hymenobacteraceae bacterium]
NDNSISGLDWTGGQTGWTGRNNSTNTTGSGGWVTARHTLPTLANQSTVRFRIAFGSDGSVQDDGFAFDDFKVIETPTVSLGNDTTVCGGITLNAGNPGATYAWNTGATTQTVLADTSGTYVVTITDVNGLTATDSVTVTVNAVPVVALGNDTTICAGSAIVLNAGNPGATYMWSDNSTAQTLTVTTAGTYWVDVTNGNSCTTRDSVVVSVASLPTVNLGTDITQCGGTVTLDAGNAGATYLWSTGATTQTVTVSATGTYMVTVTNASGCSNTDTISVTINSAPVVNLGNDTTICAGTTLTLDAGNAGATYLWSNNSTAQTLAVTTAGTYWVDVTANGCTTRDSVVVSVNPLPIASFTMVQTGMGVAFTNTGSTGAGVTYAWDFGDNSTSTQQNPTHTYTSVGSYTIRLIVTNSCGSDTTTQNITIVGVKNALAGKSVAVYPNPTTGMAEIELKGYKGEVSLLLFNATGQQVQAQQFTATNDLVRQPINLTGMPSGVYILRTISEGQMQFHKIILE